MAGAYRVAETLDRAEAAIGDRASRARRRLPTLRLEGAGRRIRQDGQRERLENDERADGTVGRDADGSIQAPDQVSLLVRGHAEPAPERRHREAQNARAIRSGDSL